MALFLKPVLITKSIIRFVRSMLRGLRFNVGISSCAFIFKHLQSMKWENPELNKSKEMVSVPPLCPRRPYSFLWLTDLTVLKSSSFLQYLGPYFSMGLFLKSKTKISLCFLSLGNGYVMTVLTFPSNFIFGRSCINRPCCQSQVFQGQYSVYEQGPGLGHTSCIVLLTLIDYNLFCGQELWPLLC